MCMYLYFITSICWLYFITSICCPHYCVNLYESHEINDTQSLFNL